MLPSQPGNFVTHTHYYTLPLCGHTKYTQKYNIDIYSHACAIPDPVTDTVVVTGGDYEGDYGVTMYDQQGWLEDLPPLITGRMGHACTSFMSSGRVVS